MAVITKTIQPGEKSNDVTNMQKALITLGANIASGELFTDTIAGTYGPTTQAAVGALYTRFTGSVPPNPLIFDGFIARLLNVTVGIEAGNNAALRIAVRESFAAVQVAPVAGPSELAWLARYATMARDFTTARTILNAIVIPTDHTHHHNFFFEREKEKIASIVNLTTLQPPAPELLNPENYYTVLYDYVPRNTINFLVRGA